MEWGLVYISDANHFTFKSGTLAIQPIFLYYRTVLINSYGQSFISGLDLIIY